MMHSTQTILEDHARWSYPINECDIAMIEDAVLSMIREATGKEIRVKGVVKTTWPGLPAGHIPIRHRTIVQNMIEAGTIVRIGKPRTVDPTSTAYFYKIA